MLRHLAAGVSIALVLSAPTVHGAKPDNSAVMTHQAANLKAGQQPSSSANQAPSSAVNPTRFHMVPSTSGQQQQQAPPIIDNSAIQKPQPTSKQPAPQQVKVPDVAKPREINTSSQRQPSEVDKAPTNVGDMVPTQGLDQLAGIRDANQARIFEEARQAADALRDLANANVIDGVNPDLGLGGSKDGVDPSELTGHDVAGYEMTDGSLSMPELPSNQKGRTGQASASLRPM